MEPRIATLLGGPSQERTAHDSTALVTPSSNTQRPRPVEPTTIGDDAPMLASSFSNELKAKTYYSSQLQDQVNLSRPNPGAPIARVLNDETPVPHKPHPGFSAVTSPTTPFSGRLVDLLLDSSEQLNKRINREDRSLQPALASTESSVIQLPKLPQPPKSTTRRPRIPPLLQGLHQPPPLPPEGRLFPPITSKNKAFSRAPGERGNFDPFAEDSRGKAEDEHVGSGISLIETSKDTQHDENVREHYPALTIPSSEGAIELLEKQPLAEKASQTKRGKRRNMWSEQETKDLLVGVSKYGIGNWKKILQDPNFNFKGRSAVDWYSFPCIYTLKT